MNSNDYSKYECVAEELESLRIAKEKYEKYKTLSNQLDMEKELQDLFFMLKGHMNSNEISESAAEEILEYWKREVYGD